jgi:hypothetical protein
MGEVRREVFNRGGVFILKGKTDSEPSRIPSVSLSLSSVVGQRRGGGARRGSEGRFENSITVQNGAGG